MRGLAINEWEGSGVVIDGASGVQVDGNNIGTDPAGMAVLANLEHGVYITGSGTDNTVGGTTYARRNVISGNSGSGVAVESAGSFIYGNFIGTDASGSTNLPNGGGVGLGSSSNTVGGNTAELRNVISGNFGDGIGIGGNSNLIQGNYIGVDVNGDVLGNGGDGMSISGSCSGNTIGGDSTAGEGNVISGNGGSGIYVASIASGTNQIYGNLYRHRPDRGRRPAELRLRRLSHRRKRPEHRGQRRRAGQRHLRQRQRRRLYHLLLHGNTLAGNLIGTDASGASALPNGGSGVTLANNADNNAVGGATAGFRNVISGNSGSGVNIDGSTSDCNYNTVQGNYLGVNASGDSLGNGGDGVSITSCSGASNYPLWQRHLRQRRQRRTSSPTPAATTPGGTISAPTRAGPPGAPTGSTASASPTTPTPTPSGEAVRRTETWSPATP